MRDQTSHDAPRGITPLIIDRTLHIVPRHQRAIKIDFKLENLIFNSGKSLEIH